VKGVRGKVPVAGMGLRAAVRDRFVVAACAQLDGNSKRAALKRATRFVSK